MTSDPAAPLGDEPHDQERDEELAAERAHLLPEEVAAGSDDPIDQAEAILADSEERTEHPEETRDASPQSPERAHPGAAPSGDARS